MFIKCMIPKRSISASLYVISIPSTNKAFVFSICLIYLTSFSKHCKGIDDDALYDIHHNNHNDYIEEIIEKETGGYVVVILCYFWG